MTDKTKKQDIQELVELRKEYNSLKATLERELDNKKDNESIFRKLILSSQEFIQFTNDTPDYDKILQLVLDISGAKYAAFNVFDENGLDFTTVAIAGIKENIKKGLHFLGFYVQNKHWNHDLNRAEKTKQQIITRFSNLHELTGDSVPKKIISLIEKIFSLKETFIVKIVKENKVIGDFTLLFKNGETLRNSSFVELYASQIGLFFDRIRSLKQQNQTQEYLRIKEEIGRAHV